MYREGVWTCEYSNDGNLLASGSSDFTSIIWDTKTNAPIKQFKEHEGFIYWTKFNEDATLMATGGEDSKIVIIDVRKMAPI